MVPFFAFLLVVSLHLPPCHFHPKHGTSHDVLLLLDFYWTVCADADITCDRSSALSPKPGISGAPRRNNTIISAWLHGGCRTPCDGR